MKTAIFVDISRHSLGLATRRRGDLLSACLVVVCAFRPTNCNSPHRVFIGNVRHTYQVCVPVVYLISGRNALYIPNFWTGHVLN